jgi:hypothetical protein
MRPTRRLLQRVWPGETAVVVRLRISYRLPLKGSFLASPAPRRAVQKKQMPFLAVATRLAVRAVKGAPFAFTGAKRKPLTEEAHGLGAGFCQEGQIEMRVFILDSASFCDLGVRRCNVPRNTMAIRDL